MIDAPKTKEEAKKKRYNDWAGNPGGRPYQEGRCAYEVWPNDRSMVPTQCSFKARYGPDNLYCKRHAKIVEERSK